MNFFGHHYIDAHENDPYYNFGLVYPDLFRDLLREHALKSTIQPESSSLIQLNKGIKQHLERDKWFHHTDIFNNGYEFVKNQFKKSGLNLLIPRSWFLAHVFFEMALDRQIVRIYTEKVEALYNDMVNVNDNALKMTEWFCNYEQFEKMSKRLIRICGDRYIFAYTNNEMFLFALWRVYKQAGLNTELMDMDKINAELEQILSIADISELFNPQLLEYSK